MDQTHIGIVISGDVGGFASRLVLRLRHATKEAFGDLRQLGRLVPCVVTFGCIAALSSMPLSGVSAAMIAGSLVRTETFAHRGAAGSAPENTRAAFAAGRDSGAE